MIQHSHPHSHAVLNLLHDMGLVTIGTRDYADEMGAGTLTLWRVA